MYELFNAECFEVGPSLIVGHDTSHVMGKHALISLSLSYPKKDWQGVWGLPANPSFGMTPTTEYNLSRQQGTILYSV